LEKRSALPSVDRLLRDPHLADAVGRYGVELVKGEVRELLAAARSTTSPPVWLSDRAATAREVEAALVRRWGRGLVPVFNLTGTLLHTNLGRAVLDEGLIRIAVEAATHPVALEYDLEAGARGDRDRLIEPMLCALTGAEAATVVNNNAAAVLLTLNTLALGREVPVSRGELIEIGGSFRMPDIIERAGGRIREVGTTNRTHPRDFEQALGPATALLLKVHPSNYRIEGFTRQVETSELAAIAGRQGLPTIVDLGSGALIDMERFGLPHEPTPRETLRAGADVVTFSGDKLLGGVQAGFIVGRSALVERIRSNPLKRALRCDKITLAILREVLRVYQDPETVVRVIPLLRTLARPLGTIKAAADRLATALSTQLGSDYGIAVVESRCQIGSGALPETTLPSFAVRVSAAHDHQLRTLTERLRHLSVPVLGRIHDGDLWLDLRAADDVAPIEAELARLDGKR